MNQNLEWRFVNGIVLYTIVLDAQGYIDAIKTSLPWGLNWMTWDTSKAVLHLPNGEVHTAKIGYSIDKDILKSLGAKLAVNSGDQYRTMN